MTEAVVVGVRVRPFNDREKKLQAEMCIKMQSNQTTIIEPSGKEQTFTFDQSFWSFDGFEVEENGYCRPIPFERYADQKYVFDTFGKRVLDNAWQGYHCCLFAYGQTGAGKSYSMFGYGNNKGIVPIFCEDMFETIGQYHSETKSCEVCVSMVEIYNESVQDLYVPKDERPIQGYTLRETKALGVYVEGVVKQAVDTYDSLERAIEQGSRNRTIGETKMNQTSSRSHTVVTIEFKQVENVGGVSNCKVSHINLIDLAGSEKSNQTGATGDRLKEGNMINKSLSALGNCIEKLAEKSGNPKKAKDIVVPYRDSKLTRLLQNALGGSSKTIMICALSPASSNYDQTISTLRYADRAKKIKNAAVVNENPQEKLLREMREENAKLKAMLDLGGDAAGALKEQQKHFAELEKVMVESQKSFTTRLEESKKRDEEMNQKLTMKNVGMGNALIVNLNAEMQLTGKLKFEIPEDKGPRIIGGSFGDCDSNDESSGSSSSSSASSGSGDEEERANILLSSPGVLTLHAKVESIGRRCFLTCFTGAESLTWVNGASVTSILKVREETNRNSDESEFVDVEVQGPPGSVPLCHCDRVTFGKAIFLFVEPWLGIAEILIMCGTYSYAKARRELSRGDWKDAMQRSVVQNRFSFAARKTGVGVGVPMTSQNTGSDEASSLGEQDEFRRATSFQDLEQVVHQQNVEIECLKAEVARLTNLEQRDGFGSTDTEGTSKIPVLSDRSTKIINLGTDLFTESLRKKIRDVNDVFDEALHCLDDTLVDMKTTTRYLPHMAPKRSLPSLQTSISSYSFFSVGSKVGG